MCIFPANGRIHSISHWILTLQAYETFRLNKMEEKGTRNEQKPKDEKKIRR